MINFCVFGRCDVVASSTTGVADGNFGISTTRSSPTPSWTYFRSPPIPNSPFRNFSLHLSKYRRERAGSMPISFSCGDDSVKSSSQVENLEECFESSRPMSVRKVLVSGTKGVGSGTRPAKTCLCSRLQGAQMYVAGDERWESKVRDFLMIMMALEEVAEVV